MYQLKNGRWRVTVHREGRTHHVGIFDTYSEARWAMGLFVQSRF